MVYTIFSCISGHPTHTVMLSLSQEATAAIVSPVQVFLLALTLKNLGSIF
jgi:hypothetical protein